MVVDLHDLPVFNRLATCQWCGGLVDFCGIKDRTKTEIVFFENHEDVWWWVSVWHHTTKKIFIYEYIWMPLNDH